MAECTVSNVGRFAKWLNALSALSAYRALSAYIWPHDTETDQIQVYLDSKKALVI